MNKDMKKRELEAMTDLERLIQQRNALAAALKFCKSVIEKQGMFDLSERVAVQKATAALAQLDTGTR